MEMSGDQDLGEDRSSLHNKNETRITSPPPYVGKDRILLFRNMDRKVASLTTYSAHYFVWLSMEGFTSDLVISENNSTSDLVCLSPLTSVSEN